MARAGSAILEAMLRPAPNTVGQCASIKARDWSERSSMSGSDGHQTGAECCIADRLTMAAPENFFDASGLAMA
jgi:hypothetical protein